MDPRFARVTLFLHLLILLSCHKSGAARVLDEEKFSKITDGGPKDSNVLRFQTMDVQQGKERSSHIELHDNKQQIVDDQLWIYAKKDDVVDKTYDKKIDAGDDQLWIYAKKNDAMDKQLRIYDKKSDAADNQVWIYDKEKGAADNQLWKKNDALDNQLWIYDKKIDAAADNQVWIYDTKNDAVDNQVWIYDKKNGAADNQVWIYDTKNDAVDNQVWIYDKKNGAADNQVWIYDKKYDDSQEMLQTGHTSTQIAQRDPSRPIFFHLQDLKLGKTMFTNFPERDRSSSHLLLPKEKADKIPFSLKDFPSLLQFFPFSQAEAMVDTLRKCEAKPIKGETKFCATSYESMLNFARGIFGLETNVKVLSTFRICRSPAILQKYTVVQVPERISAAKMVGCHTMPYPYTVFYCHYQESEARVYKVSLEGEDGDKVEAVAVCHMDTSQWSPSHMSFRMLGIAPGTSPVCHFFTADHLVLVPSAAI